MFDLSLSPSASAAELTVTPLTKVAREYIVRQMGHGVVSFQIEAAAKDRWVSYMAYQGLRVVAPDAAFYVSPSKIPGRSHIVCAADGQIVETVWTEDAASALAEYGEAVDRY